MATAVFFVYAVQLLECIRKCKKCRSRSHFLLPQVTFSIVIFQYESQSVSQFEKLKLSTAFSFQAIIASDSSVLSSHGQESEPPAKHQAEHMLESPCRKLQGGQC